MKKSVLFLILVFVMASTSLFSQESSRKGVYVGLNIRPRLLFFSNFQVKLGYAFNDKFVIGADASYEYFRGIALFDDNDYTNDNYFSTGVFARFYIPIKPKKIDIFIEPGIGRISKWGTDYERIDETQPFIGEDFSATYGYGKMGLGLNFRIKDNFNLNVNTMLQNNFNNNEAFFTRRTRLGLDFFF